MKELLDDLFVPLDIAMELNSLGFKDPCFAHRIKNDGVLIDLTPGSIYFKQYPSIENADNKYSVNAPTFQQVSNWFLIKNMHVTYTPIFFNEALGITRIDCYVSHCNGDNYDVEYLTPKDAYIAAIKEAIEIIKKSQNEKV